MNELHLSKRLETVAGYLIKDSSFADIGSDHAYLPCYAVIKGLAKTAIAGEITEGPFQSAKNQVIKNELSASIEVRKGDGLEVIEPNEVDCITIAGMGGGLISKILDDGKEKLEGVSRLILQPNIHADFVRMWLMENEWELISEQIIEEDDKIYEILVAERGEVNKPYINKNIDAAILTGPFLMEEKNDVFKKKWSLECEHWKKIVQQLNAAAATREKRVKQKELERKIQLIEEVLDNE
ncbi:tRNA (adenine(22)-N(1))-methyltransferase [Metabacillus fastidiosus]|uniref:tRNA (adenine(22)-N(1))-methyltransferase n=1 Tax=Metabacillus fastidiosus TaxID=1458 RepID=UPI00082538F3|nr:tRNA (adenine(22)-N(1))-methyltransferase TrmK [Metabacillus fastidiosus]MED4463886.1 tRNA (adenine(22)-N(1))-methyltransferase TrmK [Metabacillus fastidiosus]